MKNRRNLKIAGVIGFILVVLITVFIVSRAYEFIFPIQKQDDSLEQVQEDPLTEEDFLHTEGAAIVNQNGERLILTGINLGGWLIQEYWMCPVQGDRDTLQWTNLQTLDTLEERFGRERPRSFWRHIRTIGLPSGISRESHPSVQTASASPSGTGILCGTMRGHG